MIFPEWVEVALKAIARRATYEQCGFIARSLHPFPEVNEYVWNMYPIRNIHSMAQDNYLMDALDQKLAYDDMDERNLQLWGAYHTHTKSASPSRHDQEHWDYPPQLHMVIATADEVRVYRNNQGTLEEVTDE